MKRILIILLSYQLLSCSHEPIKSFEGYLCEANNAVESKSKIIDSILQKNYLNYDSSQFVTSIEVYKNVDDTICSIQIARVNCPEGATIAFNYSRFQDRFSGRSSFLRANYSWKDVDSLLWSLGYQPDSLYSIVNTIVDNGFEGYQSEETIKELKNPMLYLKYPNYMIIKSDTLCSINSDNVSDSRLRWISKDYYLYYCGFCN